MKPPKTRVPDQELAADIARVAAGLGTTSLSRSAYFQHGQYSQYDIYDGGRTWEQICSLVGVACMKSEPVPDEVYFQRLAAAISDLDRLPRTGERKQFGLNFSKRRYPNLSTLVDKAIDLGFVDADLRAPTPTPPTQPSDPPVPAHATTQRPVPPIPCNTKRAKWERIGVAGFPYAPQDELGVVALFAILLLDPLNRLGDPRNARRQGSRRNMLRSRHAKGVTH